MAYPKDSCREVGIGIHERETFSHWHLGLSILSLDADHPDAGCLILVFFVSTRANERRYGTHLKYLKELADEMW